MLAAFPAAAQRFETKARHALLMDAETQTALFQKAADERTPPASMAKLMTVLVVFEALKSGQLSLDDEFVVSENAWRNGGANSGGSTMFAKVGSSVKLSDLLRGIIVQSGNDACITVAEGMAGTESAFAAMMNAEGRKLKLENSLFSEKDFTWNKIRQRNRNPLLAMNIGADGLKTGYTDASGYGLVGSAVQDGQRLITVMNGMSSEKERAEEARKLMDWGFRAFEKVTLFGKDEVVAEASVFGGDRATVPLVGKGEVDMFVPRGSRDLIKGRVVYQGPVAAPIDAGQPIGSLQISLNDQVLQQTPLYAAADVGVGTLPQRAVDGLQELLLGWW